MNCEELVVLSQFRNQCLGFGQLAAEWLLANDMERGGGGLETMLPVQPRRRQDIDKIERLGRQESIEIVIRARCRHKLSAPAFGTGKVRITNGNDLHLGNAQPGAQMVLGNHSATDDSAAQAIHGFVLVGLNAGSMNTRSAGLLT